MKKSTLTGIPFIALSVLFIIQPVSNLSAQDGAAERATIRKAIEERGFNWKVKDYGKQFPLGAILEETEPEVKAPPPMEVESLPASVDWRNTASGNYISPVKNQASCGSCWAFAGVAVLESLIAIAEDSPGQFLDLSEQILVSCADGNLGCSGGYMGTTAAFMKDEGTYLESCFPYTATNNNCANACNDWRELAYKISSYTYISRSVDNLKSAIYNYGPIQVAFYVYADFQSYGEGVYEYAWGSYVGGHAVLLVGYQDTPGQYGEGYFIVKNSWGSYWGEDGFFRIGYSQVTSDVTFGRSSYAYVYNDPPPPPPPTPPPTPGGEETPTPKPAITPTPCSSITPLPCASPTPSVSCAYRVSGMIIDRETLEGIAGADVWLEFSDDEISQAESSQADGTYSIFTYQPHEPGTVLVWASHPDYITENAPTFWACYTEINGVDVDLNRYYASPTPFCIPSPTPVHDLKPFTVFQSGDYNGDGIADIAIFREDSGMWAVRNQERVYFGTKGDRPVPGDYNGDGTTEIAVFRENTGMWAIRGGERIYFGKKGDDPVPGDYNGDGTTEAAIYRRNSGLWAVKGVFRAYLGAEDDVAVPGDYNGDGKCEAAIYRPATGLWALGWEKRIYFGKETDTPVPGDFDGDGIWEVGVYRPSAGLWAINGVGRYYFGSDQDQPIPADFDGDETDDVGIFRGSAGLWAISGVGRYYFGGCGDRPVTR